MTIVKLNKRSGSPPAYQQIIGQIEKQIQSGILRPGDKLLPERHGPRDGAESL
jgi:DNA-binding GntR family transcriptional regulator